MAIKDLAVAFNGDENSRAAVRLAVQLARQHDAALTGLHVGTPVPLEGPVQNWLGRDTILALEEAHRNALRDIEQQFRSILQEENFTGTVDWFTEDGPQNELLARFSRYFDILLIGQYSSEPEKKRHARAGDIVLMSGKPLIVVPNGFAVRPFARYSVIAWDGGRRAAKALGDAMQILEKHERIDILTVKSDDVPLEHPVPSIVRHLERHGVAARHLTLAPERGGVAQTILDFCAENAPDFLVMGAYGHMRLREDLFGGVTREVLRDMTVPVFLAH